MNSSAGSLPSASAPVSPRFRLLLSRLRAAARRTIMGMNVSSGGGSGEPEVMVDINTTPLIDVMLVLLIMLIITIPIQMHSVKMNLPVGNPPPQSVPPPVVQVDIDFDGTITWNGAPVAGGADLEKHMADVAAQTEQ